MPYTASTPTDPNQPNIRNADYQQLAVDKLTPMMQRYVNIKEQYPHALLFLLKNNIPTHFFSSASVISLNAFFKMLLLFHGN